MQEVAVRHLKTHLSDVLALVQAGERVTITSHRRPVATIEPLAQTDDALPGVVWRERPAAREDWLGHHVPATLIGDGPTMADLLLQQRGA